MAYEDESCTRLVASIIIDTLTPVIERTGVDSSCFTMNSYHFAARSVPERTLWLRAISNVKVKLRHAVMPTSELELRCYRNAVEEEIPKLPVPSHSV